MNEELAGFQEVTAPIFGKIGQRVEQKRLKLAGLSLRHIRLLICRWILRAFSGWSDSLLYTGAGERGLRSFLGGSVLAGPITIVLSLIFGLPGPVTWVVIVWAYALHRVERLAARRHRESEEGYLYSYFIGWPRFLPNKPASRWQQGAALLAVGLIVGVWDHTGGFLLAATGACVLLLEHVYTQIETEELLDIGDAGWEQAQRERTRKAVATATAVAAKGAGAAAGQEDPWEREFGTPEEREVLKYS